MLTGALLFYVKMCFLLVCHMGVSKNRGKTPKMDGGNNGSNPIKMDDLGGFPIFLVQHPHLLFP